jgi:outer membrane protein OmpA-like peptidoglycan-associated protein
VSQARIAVQELERQPAAQTTASADLAQARQALAKAESGLEERRDLDEVRHDAYTARRHAEIGLQLIAEAESLRAIEAAEARRQEVLLQARTLEAEQAKLRAERSASEARQSEQEAETARANADAAIDEAYRLAGELSAMEARETERGLMLTLSDVLFDTNGAELKSGAELTIGRLADYLANNPERRLLIEGHTDSRGTDDYNEKLSTQRAESVVRALVERGTARDRLQAEGLGEDFPVATNDTAAGMQQNRRVEILISDQDGTFPDEGRQTSSLR